MIERTIAKCLASVAVACAAVQGIAAGDRSGTPGLNPYTGQEWGFGNVPVSKVTATKLDPAQWARAMKAAEISTVVLVAKHHDGFCLWPSPLNKDYSMSAVPAPNTGRDLVRELADACRREGMKFGVYLSPWDRHQGSYASPAYVDYFFAQWNELLDNYGEISEIWLDGANGGTGWYGGANGGKGERRSIPKDYYRLDDLLQIMHKKHPAAIAFGGNGEWSSLWCGNESGVSPEKWWCPRKGRDGKLHWQPSETDFPLRRGWYWHGNERPKSLARLVKIYYESVGRGAVMNIGIAPDTDGPVHTEPDDLIGHTQGQRSGERFVRIEDQGGIRNQFHALSDLGQSIFHAAVTVYLVAEEIGDDDGPGMDQGHDLLEGCLIAFQYGEGSPGTAQPVGIAGQICRDSGKQVGTGSI